MTKQLKNIPIEVMARVLKIRNAYTVLTGPFGISPDPNFDQRVDRLVIQKKRKPLEIGITDIATEAREVLGTAEAPAYFSFFRDHLGKDLFEIISTSEEEAGYVLRRGKVRDYDEARLLDAYLEFFGNDAKHFDQVIQARGLLKNFEKENPSEP